PGLPARATPATRAFTAPDDRRPAEPRVAPHPPQPEGRILDQRVEAEIGLFPERALAPSQPPLVVTHGSDALPLKPLGQHPQRVVVSGKPGNVSVAVR